MPSGVHGLLRGASALAVVAFLGYPFLTTPGQLSLGVLIVAYMVMGLSLLVVSGWGGLVSLGQLGLAAVGGYVAAIAGGSWHLPLPFALLLGAVAAAAVAPLVGLPALRLPGPFVAIMTLAFALAVPGVLLDGDLLGGALPVDPAAAGAARARPRQRPLLLLVLAAGPARRARRRDRAAAVPARGGR